MSRAFARLSYRLICSSALFAQPVLAQTANVGASADPGDIVVTARRREESIQTVPVAVTALSARELVARGTRDIRDLAGIAPNLSIGSGARGSGIATVSLRGQENTGTGLANDPAVGIYFDEVYLGRSAGNLAASMQDMASVQVLRGPQGTLFGRNNTGGAILLTPNRPDLQKIGGSIDMSYGSYNRIDLQGVLNFPIVTDKLAVRGSYWLIRRDGFGRNVFNGFRGYNNLHQDSGRIAARWTPTDTVTFDLSYDQSRVRNVGFIAAPAGLTASSQALAATLGYYETSSNLFGNGSDPRAWVDTRGYTFRSNIDISPAMAFKVIVGRRFVRTTLDSDGDASPGNFVDTRQYMNASQWTAEAQLSGKTLQDASGWLNALNYTLGGFYFTETGLDGSSIGTSVLLGPTGTNRQLFITNQSAAGYAQFEAQTFEKLYLTLGGRYTKDERSLSYRSTSNNACVLTAFPVGTPVSVCFLSGNADFGYFSYSAGARYEFSPEVNVYVKYDKGQRAGGLSSAFVSIDAFQPEIVRSVELGAKVSLLDGKLRTNIAVFSSTTDNIQRQITIVDPRFGPYNGVFNIARGAARGFELEASVRPIKSLSLGGSLGYLDAHYTQFIDPRPSVAATIVNGEVTIPAVIKGADVSYLKFPNSPKWTFSLTGEYQAEIGDDASLTLRADYTHKSFYYFEVANVPRLSQPAFGLLNGRIQLDVTNISWGSRLSVAAFARNLTNTRYNATGFNVLGGVLWRNDNPRTFGGEVRVEF